MRFDSLRNSDRAVSPVIGVILMVAITVILAAVIGAFVLGLGDGLGDSSGPQASLSFDGDTDGVTITHNGGDDLENAELRGSAISGEETFDLTAGQEYPVQASLTEGTLNVVVDGSVVGSYNVPMGEEAEPVGSISGTVTDGGDTWTGSRTVVFTINGEEIGSTEMNSGENYTLNNVPVGNGQEIIATADDLDGSATVDIVEGETTSASFTLTSS